jgi:glutamyl-tRNA reductase
VPRDIEPEVAQLDDVYLYTVDDLSTLVQTAGEKRQAAVQQAEAIIDAGVQSFAHWLDQRAAVPLIQALNRQADDWGAMELARARKSLARGESAEKVLEALARGITHKMLHGTLAELHAAEGDERQQLADTVSRLFLRQGPRSGSSSGEQGL